MRGGHSAPPARQRLHAERRYCWPRTHDKHPLVALQLLIQRGVERVTHGHLQQHSRSSAPGQISPQGRAALGCCCAVQRLTSRPLDMRRTATRTEAAGRPARAWRSSSAAGADGHGGAAASRGAQRGGAATPSHEGILPPHARTGVQMPWREQKGGGRERMGSAVGCDGRAATITFVFRCANKFGIGHVVRLALFFVALSPKLTIRPRREAALQWLGQHGARDREQLSQHYAAHAANGHGAEPGGAVEPGPRTHRRVVAASGPAAEGGDGCRVGKAIFAVRLQPRRRLLSVRAASRTNDHARA